MAGHGWSQTRELPPHKYVCGYCGHKVASNVGWQQDRISNLIYICPNCTLPTLVANLRQIPGPLAGDEIDHLPADVESLYKDIRRTMTVAAYSLVALGCRKLLMHVAVEKGDQAGKPFIDYVEFLDTNHYIPPDARKWVDELRRQGNIATHQIVATSEEDAMHLLTFVEMLLKLVYEFPNRV